MNDNHDDAADETSAGKEDVMSQTSRVLQPDATDPDWQHFCADLFRLLGSELPGRCHGGENTRYARCALEERGYDADASLLLYRRSGGYCDCEVLFNTAELFFVPEVAGDDEEPPAA